MRKKLGKVLNIVGSADRATGGSLYIIENIHWTSFLCRTIGIVLSSIVELVGQKPL